MFSLSLPWWEFVVRAFVVYLFLMVALRLTGKRQIGLLSPFDFVLLLILSNAVQNSMNGGDNSISGGLILAGVLIGLNWIFSYVTFRFKKAGALLEGRPQMLVHNGVCFQDVLNREQISRSDLESAMRLSGGASLSSVKYAVLESNGKISFIFREEQGA